MPLRNMGLRSSQGQKVGKSFGFMRENHTMNPLYLEERIAKYAKMY